MSIAYNPAPTELDQILDPGWLKSVLYKDYPGVEVEGVEVVHSFANTATKARVALTLGGASADAPSRICIKGMLGEVGRPFIIQDGPSRREARFYRDLAPPLGEKLSLPPCLHAGIDESNGHGLLIMEDLEAAGCTFLSALTPYSVGEAFASVEQLAVLHACGWEGTALYERPWLQRMLDEAALKPFVPVERLDELMKGPRGDPLPRDVLDGPRLLRGLGSLAERYRAMPSTLVHGDAHAGNLYRLPAQDGVRIGLIDWQLVQQAHWSLDVAYHLAAALTLEDRRVHERDLLTHYLDRLTAFGGPKIGSDEGWKCYRSAMLYGMFLWGVTQRVDPPIIMEFFHRIGQAVVDLESYALVER